MVPDSNLLNDTTYTLHRGLCYREQNVKLSSKVSFQEETVVGSGTEIGADTLIVSSVIGRNCKIGAKCRLEGAYIWDNVCWC